MVSNRHCLYIICITYAGIYHLYLSVYLFMQLSPVKKDEKFLNIKEFQLFLKMNKKH